MDILEKERLEGGSRQKAEAELSKLTAHRSVYRGLSTQRQIRIGNLGVHGYKKHPLNLGL